VSERVSERVIERARERENERVRQNGRECEKFARRKKWRHDILQNDISQKELN
jgi:hypothetical protein